MPIIDADAHVIETSHTWDYIPEEYQQFRPTVVDPHDESQRKYWMVDGAVRGLSLPVLTAEEAAAYSRKVGRNVAVAEGAVQMEDVPARLRHMDQLGIDVQVVHPSIFIEQVTDRAEGERIICHSYNSWMRDMHKKGDGRLRWSCALPFLDIPAALEEMHFAHDNGACAVFMRPIEVNDHLLHDPYFFPIYEEAQKLKMAIAVHVGNGNPYIRNLVGQRVGFGTGFVPFQLPMIGAFHSMITSGLPFEFPELRFVFLEVSSQWIPYIIKDIQRRGVGNALAPGVEQSVAGKISQLIQDPPEMLKQLRLYVAAYTTDDLGYIMSYAGEDTLVIGTDYGHNDVTSDVEAMQILRDTGKVESRIIDKILYDNPKALYSL